MPTESAEEQGNIAIIGRQAIVDERRAVFGYELFDRSTAHDAHTAASAAALLFNALSYADTETLECWAERLLDAARLEDVFTPAGDSAPTPP